MYQLPKINTESKKEKCEKEFDLLHSFEADVNFISFCDTMRTFFIHVISNFFESDQVTINYEM